MGRGRTDERRDERCGGFGLRVGEERRSGGRKKWGREKAVSWSDSNRTSATLPRPRSQR